MTKDCKIIEGNCIDVLKGLDSASFDAVITDPPYSSGGMFRGDRALNPSKKYSRTGSQMDYLDIPFSGDNMDQRAFIGWTAYWLSLCRRVVKPGGVAAIFSDWRQLAALYDAIQWGGWILRGVIVWDKRNARPYPGRPRQQCEFVVWASNGSLDPQRPAPYMPGMISCSPPSTQKRLHQTEKPLDLMRELVHVCEDGGRIIDPYAGSGTTICAAYLEGFSGLGVECVRYYAEQAQNRLTSLMEADND